MATERITLNVLLADDKEDEYRVTKQKLEQIAAEEGFRVNVDWANHAAAAVYRLDNKDYDLVLLDINFQKAITDPDKRGGFKIAEAIQAGAKAEHYQGRVYFFSGESTSVQKQAESYGIPFIKKVWKPRPFPWQMQPEDAHTYSKLKGVMKRHYLAKANGTKAKPLAITLEIIISLMYTLTEHPAFPKAKKVGAPIGTNVFAGAHWKTEVPNSYIFQHKLPDQSQSYEDSSTSTYWIFSMRRLLVNMNVAPYEQSLHSKIGDAFSSRHSSFSSDGLVASIRADKELARILLESGCPYAVLGKLETYKNDDPDQGYRTKRPILVVPGADQDDMKKILAWEEASMVYEKEVNIMGFRIYKRISKTEYEQREQVHATVGANF